MFRIKFQPMSKNYKFEKTDGSIFVEGNIHQISMFAIQHGIQQNELTNAYISMSKKLHTIAEFGLEGRFMCSHGGLREESKLRYKYH